MKEYGPRQHVSHVIVRESIKILIIASVISTVGGVWLQSIQTTIITVLPLLILIPALNDMVGDFGTIISSKFTTALHLGRIKPRQWWTSTDLKRLMGVIGGVAAISAVYIGLVACLLAALKGFVLTADLVLYMVGLSAIVTAILVTIIATLSIAIGLYVYSRGEDPNNFLIPIVTAIADLGSMAIFSVLVMAIF